MTRTLEQIEELRRKHAIEVFTDFLIQTKKSIREVTWIEYQQRVAQWIVTLGEKTKREQDRALIQIIQTDRSFMWDN